MPQTYALIPFLPMLGVVLCTLCAIFRVKSKAPAFLSVLCLGASFVLTVMMYRNLAAPGAEQHYVIHAFDWINFHWAGPTAGTGPKALIANFSFYVDSLTCLWMLFVTGLATLIALYASEYMAHDVGPGYCRFFAAFNLFVFSMACLVMGDNLILLYLGWEGVGLCSYLLIGYFYKKPSAVAAAKKAFIMNRIGDLGLALGVWLAFVQFGTLEYADTGANKGLFSLIQPYLESARHGHFHEIPFLVQLIPILLFVGAVGKSAQLPLYVWLPDAMEGPTPVSALIHAATMVTAGVYLVARFFPFFLASEHALMIVAWTGALTALLAATIGMAQFDIKRIMAYSTVSQLGYMFASLGVLGAVAGPAHVFTHAFFKALLFLACGAVMHGFAGQLDLRKLSGVGKMPGWKIVSITMFVGCMNLAGVPIITAGFWSKDMILGEAFANPELQAIGWILLFTAGLTAYYTFRVFFRVFMGPAYFEPGEELHAAEDHHDEHAAHDPHHPPVTTHDSPLTTHFHPHPPGWAINLVLAILALATFAAIPLVHVFGESPKPTWISGMVNGSTTGAELPHHEHAKFLNMDAHEGAMYASIAVGLFGIFIAGLLHWAGRTTAAVSRADSLLPLLGPIPKWAQHKWYVDELYNFLIVVPLRVLSHILHIFDKLVVDGLVNLFGFLPRGMGSIERRGQTGHLHDYAFRMATGVCLMLLIIIAAMASKGGILL